jgi:hypothetical protein
VSSLVRRIQLRLMEQVHDLDAYRDARRALKANPRWNRPLLKSGRQPKALRRSKKSQRWLQARAKVRAA